MRFSNLLSRMIPLSALAVIGLVGAPAAAQDSGGTRVGVVNPNYVLTQMKETQELTKKLKVDTEALEGERRRREGEVKLAEDERNNTKPDSPAYAGNSKAYLEKAIAYRAWYEMQNLDLTRRQKTDLRTLYDKIEKACREVAMQKRLDLVIAEQNQKLPDNLDALDPNAVRTALGQRNVLFKGAGVDISDAVVARLDLEYNGSGK